MSFRTSPPTTSIVLPSICYELNESRTAKAADIAVEMKFTPLFPSSPRRSSVAPRKLSASIPATPAPVQIGNARHANRPIRAPTRPTVTAPATPANVPANVIAPFVPGASFLQFVTRRGLPPKACPISLETVSAAASASAAAIASRSRRSGQTRANATAKAAAVPKLAKTCKASLPPGSAVPRLTLRGRPSLVQAQVSKKTVSRRRKPPIPPPHRSPKQMAAPANAPPVVTPRTTCPKPRKWQSEARKSGISPIVSWQRTRKSQLSHALSRGKMACSTVWLITNARNHAGKHHI